MYSRQYNNFTTINVVQDIHCTVYSVGLCFSNTSAVGMSVSVCLSVFPSVVELVNMCCLTVGCLDSLTKLSKGQYCHVEHY